MGWSPRGPRRCARPVESDRRVPPTTLIRYRSDQEMPAEGSLQRLEHRRWHAGEPRLDLISMVHVREDVVLAHLQDAERMRVTLMASESSAYSASATWPKMTSHSPWMFSHSWVSALVLASHRVQLCCRGPSILARSSELVSACLRVVRGARAQRPDHADLVKQCCRFRTACCCASLYLLLWPAIRSRPVCTGCSCDWSRRMVIRSSPPA
jgi:hypothetical protein